MKRILLKSLFGVLVLLSASCSEPAEEPSPGQQGAAGANQAASPAAASAKRPARPAEPISWDAQAGAFVMEGRPLGAAKLWKFENSVEGFGGAGVELTPAAGGGLKVVNKAFDPLISSPNNLGVEGGRYPTVLVRLTRVKEGGDWDGALYYTTGRHATSEQFVGKPLRGADPAPGETTILVYDMAHPAAGGDDWTKSTINQFRLDTENKVGGEFVIHQIAVVDLALKPAAK